MNTQILPKQQIKNRGIIDCIGNTPLIPFKRLFPESKVSFYGKLEMFNPGGSIKDRTALNILQHAIDNGFVNGETTIVESTSGNMGIGLARACHYFGLSLILVTDPHINSLTESLLKTFGAEIVKVYDHDGKGGYLNTRIDKVNSLLQRIENSFWPDQYHNLDNPSTHEQTFLEIIEQLGVAPDFVFVPTSTGGTLRGIEDAIAKLGCATKVVAVDAVGSVIFGDSPKIRLIPGMGSSRASDFIAQPHMQESVLISDNECVDGCLKLLKMESVLAGGSSGAVISAMEKKLSTFVETDNVVAMIADSGERYLETIYSENWVKEHLERTR